MSGERPTVALNMVASVDGKATVAGRVGDLTSSDDQRLLYRLRSEADAVLVGATTVRTEGYGRLLTDELRAQRTARGLAPEPLLCIASGSLDLPPDVDALAPGGPRPLIVLTAAEHRLPGDPEGVEYVRGEGGPGGQVAFGPMLERLCADFGARRIVCEGGPTVNGALFADDLVDEMYVTVSPTVVGADDGPTIVEGVRLHRSRDLRLQSLDRHGDAVFLRYAVAR